MLSDYYNKTAYLKRYNDTVNELGPDYADATYWTTITTIACALQTLSVNERFAAGAQVVFATHRMFCSTDETFTEEDKFEIDSADYHIRGIENVMEMDDHLEVMLEKRT